MLHPACLQPKDQVALLSPASPPHSSTSITVAVKQLAALGLRVVLGKYALQRTGYLAGTDQQRAYDLRTAFTNPKVKGIFFSRGGDGLARVLEQLPNTILKKHPKVVVGFSESTGNFSALVTRKSRRFNACRVFRKNIAKSVIGPCRTDRHDD